MKPKAVMLIALGFYALCPLWRDGEAWQVVVPGSDDSRYDYPVAVTVDVNGDVIGSDWLGRVLNFRGTDGTELWRTDSNVLSFSFYDIAVDGPGDVLAVGWDGEYAVIKLSGIDGSELWRHGSPAAAVAADAGGNVVVGGSLEDGATETRYFTVCKFAGDDGADFWSPPCRMTQHPDYAGAALAVAVDPSGDIVAGGRVSSPSDVFTVVKYSGATGTELWRYEGTDGSAKSVFFVGGGDVIAIGSETVRLAGDTGAALWAVAGAGAGGRGAANAAGEVVLSTGSIVRKLSSTDGTILWEREVDDRADYSAYAWSVAVDANGDAFIAGEFAYRRGGLGTYNWKKEVLVAKFAAADGAELWRRLITGTCDRPFTSWDEGRTVTLNAAGDPVVGGKLRHCSSRDLIVMQLDSRTGGEISLSGRRLRLIDNANNPSKRRLVVQAKDVNVVAPPLGSPRDPTIGGASLEILNPTTGETDTFVLPAANWSAKVRSSKLKGYRYQDRALVAGPCRKVSIMTNRRLTASCKGAQIDFSLDEPLQGSLGVRLSTGTDGLDYCMLFGGEIRRDKPASQDGPGAFEARGAPTATSCAGPP
jgi:outer membrane protein assembly factor BamB